MPHLLDHTTPLMGLKVSGIDALQQLCQSTTRSGHSAGATPPESLKEMTLSRNGYGKEMVTEILVGSASLAWTLCIARTLWDRECFRVPRMPQFHIIDATAPRGVQSPRSYQGNHHKHVPITYRAPWGHNLSIFMSMSVSLSGIPNPP